MAFLGNVCTKQELVIEFLFMWRSLAVFVQSKNWSWSSYFCGVLRQCLYKAWISHWLLVCCSPAVFVRGPNQSFTSSLAFFGTLCIKRTLVMEFWSPAVFVQSRYLSWHSCLAILPGVLVWQSPAVFVLSRHQSWNSCLAIPRSLCTKQTSHISHRVLV